jgi:hypothetical protein
LLANLPTAGYINGNPITTIWAGTSFAAPLVSGVASVFMGFNSTYHPKWRTVRDAIIKSSSTNYLSGLASNDANKLLYDYFRMAVARNAASYAEGVAPKSYVAAFSDFSGLIPNAAVILDPDTGIPYSANLTFANSAQANFTIPIIPLGPQSVEFYSPSGLSGYGMISLSSIGPGLYSSNGGGNGIAAGHLYRYGSTTNNPTIDTLLTGGNGWAPATETCYLILYGTGIRGHSGQYYVQLKKDNTIYLPYAGASDDIALDQVNIGPLPTSLLSSGGGGGTWDIKLYLNAPPGQSGSILANIVQVKFN